MTKASKSTAAVGTVAQLFMSALMLMLLVGLVHSSVAAVPAWGYWECVIGQLLLDSVLASSLMVVTNQLRRL